MTFPPVDHPDSSRGLEEPPTNRSPAGKAGESANEIRCEIDPYVLADGSHRDTAEPGALGPVARDAADRFGLIRQRLDGAPL